MPRLELPDQKSLTCELVIPVRWADMDAMGHVNNVAYFRYLEIARVAWLESIGYPVQRRGEGAALVNVFCSFFRQIEYPADLLAKHYVGPPGRKSLDTYVTLERTDARGTICAAGGGRIVWYDYDRDVTIDLPARVREAARGPRACGPTCRPR